MGNFNTKNYQILVGLFLLVIGVLIVSFLTDSTRFLGFIFIFGAGVYFIISLSSKQKEQSEDKQFRSRTRDQLLKHQHRVK